MRANRSSADGGNMSIAAEASVCSICGGSFPNGERQCPHCHAVHQYQDWVRAIDFARNEFAQFQQRGLIGKPQLAVIDKYLLSLRNDVVESVKANKDFPRDSGVPG